MNLLFRLSVVLFFGTLWLSPVFGEPELSPHGAQSQGLIPEPQKLVLPTDKDGNVTLTRDQIQFVMSVLNRQRDAVRMLEETASRKTNAYRELQACVREAAERNHPVEHCIQEDTRLWKTEAQ